jgi:hypothetical protein
MKKTQSSEFVEIYEGSDNFYLADPNNVTIKKNGGKRWGVKKEFILALDHCLLGHLDGTLKKGVVLPPIRKSDNKCIWGAIDVDGTVYKDDYFKQELIEAISRLNLPLIPCFSKSKGLHLYIFFKEWTDAQKVIDILHTFLPKLNLPPDTECFPKQSKLGPNDTGNGIMLPYMHGVGNDWIEYIDHDIDEIITGTIEKFIQTVNQSKVNAEDIKIEIPKPKEVINDSAADDAGLTKLEILKKIKNKTIDQHPTMGGKYHSWIQVVIAKCIKQGYGDNEILKLIKEVHQDNRGIGYTWPESYQKQINYARKDTRLNKTNPGDTTFLEGQSLQTVAKYEEVRSKYCYVMANDLFNKLGTRDFFKTEQINNFHANEVYVKSGSLTRKLLRDKEFTKAETFVTSAKFKPGLIHIDRPKIIPLINKGIVLNIYIPNYITAKKSDIKFIIDFYIWLIGKEKWKIIEQWIAYHLQYPGEKIKWSIVLVSEVEGTGKGLLARILSRILGEENVNENANYKHLTNTHNTLLIGTQIIVLNELSLGDFKSKAEGTNTLKNFVADDTYSCNFKGKTMVVLPNLTNFLLYSQDPRVLGVNQGVRRYFFCNIKRTEEEIIKKTDEGFFQRAWDFIDSNDGAAAALHYFKYEVKIADPSIFKKRAPQTEDLKELIEASKHPLQKKLEWDLVRPDHENKKIFSDGWSGLATFDWLNEELNTWDKDETKKYDWGSFGDDAIFKFLSANGSRWNNGDSTRQVSIDGVKHRFYLLDDARCPIPGKSYKDLTPKQIEAIYKNYTSIKFKINNQEKDLKKAKEKLEENKTQLKKIIEENIKKANGEGVGAKFNNHFKDLTTDAAYDKMISGELKVINKTPLDCLGAIDSSQKIIDRGIRTSTEIIEEYTDRKLQPMKFSL